MLGSNCTTSAVGSPTASFFVTAINVSSLFAVSVSSSSLGVGETYDYLIARSLTSDLVRLLISRSLTKNGLSLVKIFQDGTRVHS